MRIAYLKQFIRKYRTKLLVSIGISLVFVIGLIANKAGLSKPNNSPSNYRGNSPTKPANNKQAGQIPHDKVGEEQPTNENPKTNEPCSIRAIDASKIYHVPGDLFYNRLKNYRCFSSEREAQAAGFRKSKK